MRETTSQKYFNRPKTLILPIYCNKKKSNKIKNKEREREGIEGHMGFKVGERNRRLEIHEG